MRELRFNNGDMMPNLGLGTWKSKPGEVAQAVKDAIQIGYRHIDCAYIYDNEAEIGEALNDVFSKSDVKREDLWITSKLWNNSHAKDTVRPALQKTLNDLQLEYLDLYLIHWPILFKPEIQYPADGSEFLPLEDIPIIETWEELVVCHQLGMSRHLGVSNFSVSKIKDLISKSAVKPEVNQVELHPLLQQSDLKDYCDSEGIYLTAYSPLGSFDRNPAFKGPDEVNLFHDVTIARIAARNNCSSAQILIRWALQRGTAVIPKSVNAGRIQENFNTLSMELSEEDMAELASMDRSFRFLSGYFWEQEGSSYTAEWLWS